MAETTRTTLVHNCDGPRPTLLCVNPLGRCGRYCIHPMAGVRVLAAEYRAGTR